MRKLILSMYGVCMMNILQAQMLIGTFVGRYETGLFDQGATEIAAYDPQTKKIFSVNGSTGKIDIIDFSIPSKPTLINSLDLSTYGKAANSVSVANGIVACAVEAVVKQDSGKVIFFNTSGTFLKAINTGALPDMITFSPDAKLVITANEGEPSADYVTDPEGSITIIDISMGVANAKTTQLNLKGYIGKETELRNQGIRIFGIGANAAQDLEPEYVTISDDSKTAWVVCQENNAMLIIDLVTKTIKDIKPLGFKDHSKSGFGLDASDRNNNVINIATHPIKGMYMPDGLATLRFNNKTYILTANEGDAREYNANTDVAKKMVEEATVKSLKLDSIIFPNAATLQQDANLGRLLVTNTLGDVDKDGDFDALYAFGARSFSIWDSSMTLIYDSGDQIEQYTASTYPNFFNVSSTNNTKQNRSDNKGPEPECVITAKIGNSTYAFVGLERFGGIMVYDVTNPTNVSFVSYMTSRDFLTRPGANTAGGDLAPEGLLYISSENSPTGKPYILSSNETSGSIAVYELGGSAITSSIAKANDWSSSELFNVYPNPSHGAFTILNYSDIAELKIYNVLGDVIKTHYFNHKEEQLVIEQLTSGLYTVEVHSKSLGVKSRKKIVVD